MAKLAVFPKCYIEAIASGDMTLRQWIGMASELPVDGLELYDKFLTSYHAGYLSEIRRALDSRNLAMPMMCYSPDFTCIEKTKRDLEIAGQKDIIKVTAELGGRYCRVLSGQKRHGVGLNDGIDWVVECIRECLETARRNNIVLVMENHYKDGFWKYPEFAQDSAVFLAIINRIDSEFFGVQYDPSNALIAGEQPLDVLEKVKSRVRTMHASDRYLVDGKTPADLKQFDDSLGYASILKHGVIGRGLNDYDAIFRILKESGFDGWVSIEDGMNGMAELAESARFLRRKMREHGLAGGVPGKE